MNLIKVKKLSEDAILPFYSREGDAAFDIVSAEHHLISPQATSPIGTGLAFEIPAGYEVEIVPRSGISLNTPLRVSNSPGTIDENYRGEVKIIMTNSIQQLHFYASTADGQARLNTKCDYVINLKGERVYLADLPVKLEEDMIPYPTFFITKGDKIAQGKLRPVIKADFEVVDELSDTNRGENGFGSSGNTAK